MSAETSKKFAWLGQAKALHSLSFEANHRVTLEITMAKSEDDFSEETREVIKQGRLEMAERGLTLS
jgi:hypothetical protein